MYDTAYAESKNADFNARKVIKSDIYIKEKKENPAEEVKVQWQNKI